MNYTKIEHDTHNIHLIQTDKFKTITVQINYKRKLLKDEITKRNFLVNILMEGTKLYPTKRLMEIKTEELYDLAYRSVNFSSGKYSVISFDMTFINPKYTEENMDEEAFKFISEIIYNPNISDNSFSNSNYLVSLKALKDHFNTIKDDITLYSQIKMLEEMNEEYISYRNIGYEEDLNSINCHNLYEYYLDVIKNDALDIFIIGDFEKDRMLELIDKYIKVYDNKKLKETHFYVPKIDDNIKFKVEKVNKEQSTLVVGFKMDNLTDYEKRYVASVYNYILGGSTESNLFKTVREDNSLCYYINSSTQSLLGISMIRSGINAKDYDSVINLIYSELNNMKNGNFDKSKIENAKTTYINGLDELEDNPDSILSLYISREYLNADLVEKRKEQIMKVTYEDVINVAKKMHLDVIYLLEGSDTSGEE